MKRHLLVLAALLFWFGSINAQTNFIHQDSVFARTSDCALGVSICIDSIAYDNINDLRFFVDGQQFSAQFTPCLVNTIHNYSYDLIFRGGERGPWRLDSWTVNGQTFNGTFNSLRTLLDSMRRWNPDGNWQLENSTNFIYGSVAASANYSCQEIFGTMKGGQNKVCYNSGVEYRGLRFNVPVGVHQLIVEKVRTGERDTVTLLAACLKPETIRRNIAIGSSATFCASQSELLGTLVSTKNFCPRPVNAITFGTPRTSCITYTGTTVGTDSACIQVCDRYGFCDTTYLIVTAATSSGNSLTFSDTISVGLRRTTCEVALPTGTLNSFTNICPQNSGNNVVFELDAGTSCVTYRGLAVGTNTACIRACNVDNVCDTTTITIQAIPYVAPVVPTRFTYNDTITVGLTRSKCSFNAPSGAVTVFENICASGSGTKVGFTLDQATKCVSYHGIAIGRDSACIRVCNASNQCDTTYMYVSAIVNGTGGGTNGGSGRTITVRDTISVGLSRENCGVSVPATVFSITNNCPNSSGTNVAFSIDPIRRCVTYRGLTVGADTACYVVCNANNVCDTTIYIVGTVDTSSKGKTITIRDTISVGLTRRNCAVSIPRGTYGSITNLCPSSSGTNVTFTYSDATRCVDYSGILVGSDTACIKVCNTNNICDTTYYIITAIENTTGGGGNRCGLRVSPFVQARSCGITGFINLAVSGSTAPYTFRWADLTGANQPQNRTGLEAGNYTVTVSSAAACDTTLTITVINNATNCGGGGGGSNRCGLAVVPTVVSKTCTSNGSISLAVTGSIAPYTFNWADLVGTNDPQNRTNLEAGIYSVTVTPSTPNCDTIIAVVVANNATNCGGGGGGSNRCGLAVVPTATPKTCTSNGSISLAVTGSTAPYTYDWTDLTGTTDPKDRTDLQAGTYTVKVTPSVSGCDTTLSVVVANNATNCGGGGGSNIRLATVTVKERDSTTYCVDSSRVLGGFTVQLNGITQTFSTLEQTIPRGCFKIKGFVAGRDSVTIILIGQNGVRDTTKLTIIVTPRNTGGGCGLVVTPTVTPKTCTTGGSITLVVSGSTAPYTFDWTDIVGTVDTQNRVNLQAGSYTVKVKSAALNCDTTLTIVVADNCVPNRCGLVVSPTVTPKTCTADGSITLVVSGSSVPYTFDWSDIVGTVDSQNRRGLAAGIYTVKVTPSVPNCDTTLSITVVNNATNCNGSTIRFATVNVVAGDSTVYCADSSRVGTGFTVELGAVTQTYSTIAQTTPKGCFKIKGFLVGSDSITIVLISQSGLRDTLKLRINVTPRPSCGLAVTPTVTPRNCTTNGSITLAVSGSTAPYFYDWTDLVGVPDPKDRTNLPAGRYTVKVTSSSLNCDTTLTVVVADNCVPNRCGLIVSPTVTPKTCTSNGTITLTVTGSTAPYTFDWSDIVGTVDSQNRTGLAAGIYIVKVTPSVSGCDTTLTITVRNEAANCGGNTCALVVSPTAVPKTCTGLGSIALAVSGGTAPYSYKWADLRDSFPRNRANLQAGIYSVIVTSASPNCDTTLRITVADDSTGCSGSRTFHKDSVTVFAQDSTTYCVDSIRARVGTGFIINISQPNPLIYSTVIPSTPFGCYKIKGFVPGRDTLLFILIGQNGVKDTTQLLIKVVPKIITPTGGQRSDTITIKILETRTYCPDSSRLAGSPVILIKFCSTDPFDNTRNIKLDTVRKCISVTGLSAGMDTFCIELQNAAGFRDATKLFVRVTRDTVTPILRIDTVRVFVGDSLTYCNIDTGQIRGNVDTIYNVCPTLSGTKARTSLTTDKCLKIRGLAVGTDTACIVVCNRLSRLCDTTRVIIIVTTRPSTILLAREDSITIQVGEVRNYCPDTSRLRGNRVTSISFCSTATFDNAVILLVDSTKCARITGSVVGQDTACLVVCSGNVCDTVKLKVRVVPERPLKDTTIIVRIQRGKDSLFCGIDTTQLRGLVDTIYDACPAKNGTKARMVIDRVTHCVRITGVNIGSDTMCVVVCNRLSRICDTTKVVAVVSDTTGGRIVVIANDDFDSLRRGTNKTLEVYNNDTIRPRAATSLKIVRPPVKGKADTISFTRGLIKYTASRSPSACGLDSFTYRVCIDSICDTAQVVILVVCPDSLRAYTAISPNGDGRNDVFFIDGLQNYPDHTVCIFNRWGNQVLNQKNYQNDWSGTWNGVNVPDGTYFYFVRNDKNGEMVLTGYVQVLR
jgi:gliding motility-associated-like protein